MCDDVFLLRFGAFEGKNFSGQVLAATLFANGFNEIIIIDNHVAHATRFQIASSLWTWKTRHNFQALDSSRVIFRVSHSA